MEEQKTFKLNKPIYQDGNRYTHRLRWYLAEMSVVGLHREEVATQIGHALRNNDSYKYSRTRLRGVADLIIHVLPGAFNKVVSGPDKVSAMITPAAIATLHKMILQSLKEYETP